MIWIRNREENHKTNKKISRDFDTVSLFDVGDYSIVKDQHYRQRRGSKKSKLF